LPAIVVKIERTTPNEELKKHPQDYLKSYMVDAEHFSIEDLK
jgi:hypothetical protein